MPAASSDPAAASSASRGLLQLRASGALRVPAEADIEAPERADDTGPARPTAPRTVTDRVALCIATAGGVGYAPGAPGTFGSAVGVVVYLPLSLLGAPLFVLTAVAITALGIWASDEAERLFGRKDDQRIVIDEVAGQLATLAPLVLLAPAPLHRHPFWLVTAFVAFRVFDIRKPGPVRWAEQYFRGGAGVVMDDVVAGLFGAAVMCAALLIARIGQLVTA